MKPSLCVCYPAIIGKRRSSVLYMYYYDLHAARWERERRSQLFLGHITCLVRFFAFGTRSRSSLCIELISDPNYLVADPWLLETISLTEL
jgi:hypothetical protein